MFNYRQILGRFKLQSGDLFPLARADPTSAVNFIFLRETCPLIKEMLKLRRFGWKICILHDTVNIFGVLNSLLYGFNGQLRCFDIKHDHVLCYIPQVLEIFGGEIKTLDFVLKISKLLDFCRKFWQFWIIWKITSYKFQSRRQNMTRGGVNQKQIVSFLFKFQKLGIFWQMTSDKFIVFDKAGGPKYSRDMFLCKIQK